ncbi:MAG: hypothetical protein O2887_10290 [Bacteroidetes bacterium]|nr:hypothetical protein [Bacteroidota bacterium]
MALPTVSARPEKTINAIVSRWNAANLPLQYSISNTKWPTNSDATVAITSITSTNGNATLQHGSSTGLVAKEWVKVAGTTNYNGAHQILSVSTNALIIDFPYGASETGTSQKYYNNYTSMVRVYAGIDPAHTHAATKPIALIGTIEQRPDTNDITLVDVRDYVKSKLNTNYDSSQTSWPNDLNGWCDFYISFAERYDLVTAGVVGNFTSAYTNDTTTGLINYCHATNSAQQFGYAYGGNMFEYLVKSTNVAKWLTDFDEPDSSLNEPDTTLNDFNLSVILERSALVYIWVEFFDFNGFSLQTNNTLLTDDGYGLYRIPVGSFYGADYLILTLKGNLGTPLTTSKTINISCPVTTVSDKFRLLEDGASFRLLEDGVSLRLLE